MIMVTLQQRSDNENGIEICFCEDGGEEKFYFETKEELRIFLRTRS